MLDANELAELNKTRRRMAEEVAKDGPNPPKLQAPKPAPRQGPARPDPFGTHGAEPGRGSAQPLVDELPVERRPVGFGRRLGAYLVDLFFICGVSFGAGLACAVAGIPLTQTGAQILAAIVVTAYAVVLEASDGQGTLGKQFLGCRVVDSSGRTLSVGAAWLRCAAKFYFPPALLLSLLFILTSDRGRALHDMVAGSEVVDR